MPNQPLPIIVLEHTSGTRWEATMRIYRDAFPTWEREPENTIAERVNQGRYTLKTGLLNGKVVGFYLLDLNTEPSYAILIFLAVDVRHRGHGWGTLFCRDAMAYFKTSGEAPWLFVEAQEHQADFYGRLGFLKLDVYYQVPCFGEPGSVPMRLMVFPKKEPPASFQGAELARIMRNIFIQGYQLNSDDPRISEQLARIKNNVKLIT